MLISRAQNARLQVLRGELMKLPGFGEEAYRDILEDAAGVRSAREIPPAKYPAVMEALAATLNAAVQHTNPHRAPLSGSPGDASPGRGAPSPLKGADACQPPPSGGGVSWGGKSDSAVEIAEKRARRPRLAAVGGEPVRYATPRTVAKIFERGAYLFGLLNEGTRPKLTPAAWVKSEVIRLTDGIAIDDLTHGQATSVLQSFKSRIGHIKNPRGQRAHG